jgi:hypothetical protein
MKHLFLLDAWTGTIENAFVATPTHWHYPLEKNEQGLRMIGLEDFFQITDLVFARKTMGRLKEHY